MKICSDCLIEKPLTDFHANPRYRDGHVGQCKLCRAEKTRQNYRNNKEKDKIARAAWRAKNKDKVAGYQRKYRELYPEVFTERRRKWEANNKEAIRHLASVRRAKIKNNGIFAISKKELSKLYSSPCFYCGSTEKITMDHVVPIDRGGTHSIGNLVPACSRCNSSKRVKTIMEWRVSNSPLHLKVS